VAAVSRDEQDIGYPPAHHFLRDLGAVTEQRTAERSVTAAPVTAAMRGPDRAAALGFLATLVDINAAMVALIAGAPDWTATADLALHVTEPLVGQAAVVDSRLVRAGSNIVVVGVEVTDGGDEADLQRLLDDADDPDGRRPSAATGLITFARIPRKASVASDGFDPRSIVGERREMVAAGAPPTEPVLERIGLLVVDAGAGVVELPRTDYVRNSFGAINGGVLGLVFQGAAEAAVPGHASSDLQIHYLAQAKVGPARTTTRVVRRRPGSALCHVEVRDAGHDDLLLAVATVGLTAV
jgi:acyl-coenzyme A thioesterase PaaI-like protein